VNSSLAHDRLKMVCISSRGGTPEASVYYRTLAPSFLWRQESRLFRTLWTPAFARGDDTLQFGVILELIVFLNRI